MTPRDQPIRTTLASLAGALTLAAPMLPEPGPAIARIVAAGLGAAAAMLDEGASLEEATARIKRVRRIDTSAEDAAVDARVAALPSATDASRAAPPTNPFDDSPLAAPVGAWSEPTERTDP